MRQYEHETSFHPDMAKPKDLSTPTSLEEGQDFYAQPPFAAKIVELAQNTGRNERQIKQTMTHFFGNIDVITALHDKERPVTVQQLLTRELPSYLATPERRTWMDVAKKTLGTTRRDRITETVTAIDHAFREYSEWQEYINALRDQKFYDGEGTYNRSRLQEGEKFNGTTTYETWARKRAGQKDNEKLIGLDPILPRLATQNEINPSSIQPGKGKQARYWGAMKAGNLTRDRSK